LDESPGAVIEENGEKFKEFRGMGSPEAMEEGGAARYMNDKTRIRIAEGKVVRVPYRGAGEPYLDYLIAGIRQGMHKLGFMSIQELQDDAMIIPARYAT
jgi:IMP dehydrogenase